MSTRIDTENLQSLIRHFHIATKLRVAIFDFDFNEIIAWPEKETFYAVSSNQQKKAGRAAAPVTFPPNTGLSRIFIKITYIFVTPDYLTPSPPLWITGGSLAI